MNRGRALILTLALCALAAIALPAAALARTAYFTGTEGEAEGYAAPIELSTGGLGTQLWTGTEGAPSDVAITPDGSTAYVADYEGLVAIDVATGEEVGSIPIAGGPRGVAISPDGKRAYTANGDGTVSVIDLATGTEVGTPISIGGDLRRIAVTPDGSRAYVTDYAAGEVVAIDLASGTEVGRIAVGAGPQGIAVTPDGSRVLVANRDSQSVSVVDTATNGVVATIPLGSISNEVPTEEIAVSPDGGHAYVIGFRYVQQTFESAVTPIDIAAGTAGTPVAIPGYVGDIAILPDGTRAYITHSEVGQIFAAAGTSAVAVSGDDLLPFDLATNSLEAGLPTYEEPEALAIVPNQPPHAVIEGPETATAGDELSFDGSKSTDSDGTVARYDWNFGDGTGAADAGPTVHHAYAAPGTYQVTLTTTDNEGCSTALVFTGQTAYCNGSDLARATHQVVVAAGPVPATTTPATTTPATATRPATLARCRQVSGRARSFVPRIRPGHVVPGLRVRLAVPTPSRLDVRTKLLWSQAGKQGSAGLHKLSVDVRHWRRLRFPVPSRLRQLLPLGTRVTLKLAIRTTPLHGAACSATLTHKTLHVRVVKVFPDAVQAHRPR